LPLPVHGPEFLAVFQQHGPKTRENSLGDPSLHRSMNRRVVAESPRQLLPLHAAAHPIDDAIERLALPGAGPTGRGRWVQFVENLANNLPQFVADFLVGSGLTCFFCLAIRGSFLGLTKGYRQKNTLLR
jgi:hypothetical protein